MGSDLIEHCRDLEVEISEFACFEKKLLDKLIHKIPTRSR